MHKEPGFRRRRVGQGVASRGKGHCKGLSVRQSRPGWLPEQAASHLDLWRAVGEQVKEEVGGELVPGGRPGGGREGLGPEKGEADGGR